MLTTDQAGALSTVMPRSYHAESLRTFTVPEGFL